MSNSNQRRAKKESEKENHEVVEDAKLFSFSPLEKRALGWARQPLASEGIGQDRLACVFASSHVSYCWSVLLV